MEWELEGERWSYAGSPVKDLNGLWKRDPNEGFHLDPAAEQKPVLGEQAASIYADSIGAHYSVGVTNGSDETWRDVHTWICLDHFHTPVTRISTLPQGRIFMDGVPEDPGRWAEYFFANRRKGRGVLQGSPWVDDKSFGELPWRGLLEHHQ